MHDLVNNQKEFFNSGVTREITFRKKQLRKLKSLLKAHEKELCTAIHSDFRKSEFITLATEFSLIYTDIGLALKNLDTWAERKSIPTNLVNFPARSYVLAEPLGVSLIIGPWNYPYLLSLAPTVAAIAAGCTVILKPSELTRSTSAAIARLINNNFDPGFLKVVEGGVPETQELLKNKFDKIFFTGSPRVGKIIYQAAAEHITPVTLELGGKCPAFVTADCNLKMVVKRLIWAKFINSGQTCNSPDYVMVEEKIRERFLKQCVEEIEKRAYSVENENYSQIINQTHLERLEALIDPAKVYYGGKVDKDARTVEPTILVDVSFNDKVMEEEIFGPILPVIPYTDLDTAIEQVRSLPKPLACYVFSNNSEERKKVMQEISFGCGAENEAVMQITNRRLPFGGVGLSGIGKYNGEAGFGEFSNYKSILRKTTHFELSLKYHPLTKMKLWWIRTFFKF